MSCAPSVAAADGRHECGRLPRLIDGGLQVGDQAVGQEMAACIVRRGFQ